MWEESQGNTTACYESNTALSDWRGGLIFTIRLLSPTSGLANILETKQDWNLIAGQQ